MKDEVEEAIFRKYLDYKNRREGTLETTEVPQVKRQAVIDNLLQNENYIFSVAEQKRAWKGIKKGPWPREEVDGWWRAINQTKL